MIRKNSSKRGFTLMEIIIAAAIFSIFIVAVLSFYRMGSRIFTGGSWKQHKQKDAERFLNFARERINRASFPVAVGDDGKFTENPANFGYASGSFEVKKIPTNGKRLLCFVVCKAKIKNDAGVIMYHTLRAIKKDNNSKDFTLEMVSTNNVNSGDGSKYFNASNFNFFETTPNFDDFKGNPLDYSLGPATSVRKVDDVTNVTISHIKSNEGDQIIIDITFTHPKMEKTRLNLKTSALVGNGLKVNEETSL